MFSERDLAAMLAAERAGHHCESSDTQFHRRLPLLSRRDRRATQARHCVKAVGLTISSLYFSELSRDKGLQLLICRPWFLTAVYQCQQP